MALNFLLSSHRRILVAFLCFSCSIIFISFLSSPSLQERFRDYTTSLALFSAPARLEKDGTNISECHPNNFISGHWSQWPIAKLVYSAEDAFRSSGIYWDVKVEGTMTGILDGNVGSLTGSFLP